MKSNVEKIASSVEYGIRYPNNTPIQDYVHRLRVSITLQYAIKDYIRILEGNC